MRRNEEKGTRNEEIKILVPHFWFLVPNDNMSDSDLSFWV